MGVVDPHQGVLEALFLADGVRMAEELGAEEERESFLKRFGTRTRGDGGCGRAQLRAQEPASGWGRRTAERFRWALLHHEVEEFGKQDVGEG
jgi:hypothetical protein